MRERALIGAEEGADCERFAIRLAMKGVGRVLVATRVKASLLCAESATEVVADTAKTTISVVVSQSKLALVTF